MSCADLSLAVLTGALALALWKWAELGAAIAAVAAPLATTASEWLIRRTFDCWPED